MIDRLLRRRSHPIASTAPVSPMIALILICAVAAAGCRSSQSDVDRPGLRVRPTVAFEMLSDAPYMPVLDLRDEMDFEGPLGHLARARNLPAGELEESLEQLELLRGLTFLIYCTNLEPACDDAMRLFLGNGFPDVVLMEGGIEAWLRAGYGTLGGPDSVEMAMPEDPGMRIPVKVEGGGDRTVLPDPP